MKNEEGIGRWIDGQFWKKLVTDLSWVFSGSFPLALEPLGKGRREAKVKAVQEAAASWVSADRVVEAGACS